MKWHTVGGLAILGLLIAAPVSAASAADMPLKAPPPAPPPAYSWTGFYVGGNVGYGWSDPTVTFTPNDIAAFDFTCGGTAGGTCAPPASFNIGGVLGGLQAGYNLQFNRNWLLGIETDFDWSRIQGTGTSNFFLGQIPPAASNFQATEDVEWFGTVRGRLGFLPANNVLIYGTGGFAYGRVADNVALNSGAGVGGFVIRPDIGFSCVVGPNCFLGSSSRTDVGWTAGAGLEYSLSQHLSVKAEYLYVNLGGAHAVNVAAQFAMGATPSSFTATYSTVDFQVVRAGLNWKF
jgi:outer membrane immunogenic protein